MPDTPPYVVGAIRALLRKRERMGYDAPRSQHHITRIISRHHDKRAGEWLREASAEDYTAALDAAMGREEPRE